MATQEELLETAAKEAKTLRSDLVTARTNSNTLSAKNMHLMIELTKTFEELNHVKVELAKIKAYARLRMKPTRPRWMVCTLRSCLLKGSCYRRQYVS